MAIAFSPSTGGPLAPWPRYPGPPHFINPGQPPAASYHGSPSSRAAAALSGRGARRLLCPPAPRHTRSYGSFALVTVGGRQGMRCSLRGCSAGGCIRKPVLVHCQRRYRDGAVALHYHIFYFSFIQIIGLIGQELSFGVRLLTRAFLKDGLAMIRNRASNKLCFATLTRFHSKKKLNKG